MQSEAMGKTMAIFMVMAMIATGIATLIPNAAAGDPQITGTVLSSVAPYKPIEGVTVEYTGVSGATPITTTDSQGKFILFVSNVTKEDFTLTFKKDGFVTGTRNFLATSYIGDICATNTTTMVPDPTVSGIVKEMGTEAPISGVEVNIIDKSTSWVVVEQVMTGTDGKFSCQVSGVFEIDIYFKINGYYSIIEENVDITAGADVGEIFLEKIVPTPTYKLWGVVFDEDTQDTLAGALVSISEGDDKWITALSNEEGKYEMYAYSGNFQIKCSKGGYFTKIDDSWVNIPADKRRDISLESTPMPEDQTLEGYINRTGNTGIPNAIVTLHSNPDGKYVKSDVTNDTGYYNISFYIPGTFTVEVNAEGYYTDASITNIAGSGWRNITLNEIGKNWNLRGYVIDHETNDYIAGATVQIFDNNAARVYTNSTITDENGYYGFNVSNGTSFAVLVDAVGYQSKMVNTDPIIKNTYLEVGLLPSGTDDVETTYTFVDWNTLQVTRNSIITVDNISVRADAERKFGMGDLGLVNSNGDLDADEITNWATELRNKGLEKRDTKGFLALNNTFYNLDVTSYGVDIKGALGPVSADATLFINSTYNYTLAGTLENADSLAFTMGFNATYDTLYVDYTNNIILPLDPVQFEMTSNVTETNKVTVTGYNDPITINPMVHDGEMEQVTMTIQASMSGTAKAKILSGVHYVMNSTYDNYTVIVPRGPIAGMDTTVTFSAEDSTDPVGNINKANYTWTLGDGTTAYGMKVEHNYTNANVSGLIAVKLVITETGGNQTNRSINVWLDSQNPVAAISAVVTDSENISYASNVLTVMEDFQIFFSGVKFSDAEGMGTQTIAGVTSYDDIKSGDRKGLIEKWYWSWGEENSFDETVTKDGSKNITHVYNTPGTYTLNMIATDVVGRESANATWTVKVSDITAPIPDFNIKNADKVLVTEAIENKPFTYNASTTTDNFDELADISFEWSFNIDGVITTYTGMAVNHTFNKVGMYNVTLKATDVAGNSENKTMLVNVNLASRPNIIMRLGTMAFSSSPGTAGKAMTVSVNITNDGSEDATGIQTKFYIRNADGTDNEIGTATTSFLGKGNTTTVSISWTPNKKGDFSIWANSTCAGEHSSQWWDNKVDDFAVQKVTIDEAPWVMPAIIVAIVVVIIVVFLGMRYFMKSGTKDEEYGDKRKKR